MKRSSRSKRAADSRGLTLLELVVVMVILTALAGILIPLMSNITSEAHYSAAATNASEVTKAVQMYASQNGNFYPNYLDSLVDSTGALFQYLPMVTNSGSQLAADLLPVNPSTNDVSSLQAAGILNVLNMQEGASSSVTNSVWNPTFYPYGDGTNGLAVAPSTTGAAVNVSASGFLAQLSAGTTGAAARLGLSTTGTYYVFGLGDYSSMQGSAMSEAPVHWMSNMTMTMPSGMTTTMSMNPKTVYSRFGLVFQTNSGNGATNTSANQISPARFVGTVLLTGSGVATGDKPLSNFYSTQQ